MNDTIDTDVLVIGAGPMGLLSANLLADQGLRVMLVERNSAIADEPRAISITDESLRVMADVGVLDKLLPEVLADTGARYFGRKGQLLAEVRAKTPRLGQPVKSHFDQPILAGLLFEAAQAKPSVDMRFGTEAVVLTDHPEHIEANLVNAADSRRVRAKWIVACDGGRSPVRTQLGIPLEGSTQVEKWIVVDVLNSTTEPELFSQFHCNGVRPCVVVPGVKGRCRYEFMLLPGENAETVTAPDFIIDLVAPYQRIVAADIRRAAVYMAQQRIASSYRVGHVLLVGDAAHLMPPFAGQGLNAGVRDAANVAWKIAAHVRGQATDALIDSYQAERRPHAAEMVRLSHRIGKVVMNTNPVLTAVRDALVVALGIVPPAKRWLVGMRFLKQPHYTSGCIVPPGDGVPNAAAELVGRSLPQPLVQRANGERVPLDRQLGSSWALLRFPRDSVIEIQRSTHPTGGQGAQTETVVDFTGAFAPQSGSGMTLVVRPDRYVAAAAPKASESESLEALAIYVPELQVLLNVASAQGGSPPRAAMATT
ncbi:FAD-dependent monooxygenase [Variovorax sp. Root411]|uniref:FAD-dependent monooxygenase n=1 Tax=Variovorax sp. Root411 TaxID=1736530 RepID=UPI0006FCA327|nr:FAD-dependent monooxygenase [Variovorax sp. Root411]KQW64885.1 hypothetical protein ASC92_05495 [Variovorax sp. Root411]